MHDACITQHSWHCFWHSFTCYYVRMHGSGSAIPSRDQLLQLCCPTSQQQNSSQSVGPQDWRRIGAKTQTFTRKFHVTWPQIRRAPHWARASLRLVCRERNLSVLSGININPHPPPPFRIHISPCSSLYRVCPYISPMKSCRLLFVPFHLPPSRTPITLLLLLNNPPPHCHY